MVGIGRINLRFWRQLDPARLDGTVRPKLKLWSELLRARNHRECSDVAIEPGLDERRRCNVGDGHAPAFGERRTVGEHVDRVTGGSFAARVDRSLDRSFGRHVVASPASTTPLVPADPAGAVVSSPEHATKHGTAQHIAPATSREAVSREIARASRPDSLVRGELVCTLSDPIADRVHLLCREAIATRTTVGHIASNGRRSTVVEGHLDSRHPSPATGGLCAKELHIEEAGS